MTTTFVSVNTYTYSVAHVTDQMLISLKRIITWSGLDPTKLALNWKTLDAGIRTWLSGRYLEAVVLEVYHPRTDKLVGRWDFDIRYSYSTDDEGTFWVDTDAIKHAIKKCGLIPSECTYQIIATTKRGRPEVPGWTRATLRSTQGFVRHSIGTTIGANPLASSVSYWRKKS